MHLDLKSLRSIGAPTCRSARASVENLRGSAGWRSLAVFLLFVAFVAAARALTVATYNVDNYLVANRMVAGEFRQACPKPESEKAALRQVIAHVAPDILALQEIGKPPFLAELQRDLRTDGHDYPHALVLEAADQERHVAVLSKVAFKEVREHRSVAADFLGERAIVSRGVLELTFATDHGHVSCFVLHLKSRRTVRPDDPEGKAQRQAEAAAVRDLILARFPDPAQARFAVLGDWNDTAVSPAVRTLRHRGDTELGEILPAVDSRGEYWTHFSRRDRIYSQVDFILVSAGLKPHVAQGRAQVYDGPGAPDASDHRAVFMNLNLAPLP